MALRYFVPRIDAESAVVAQRSAWATWRFGRVACADRRHLHLIAAGHVDPLEELQESGRTMSPTLMITILQVALAMVPVVELRWLSLSVPLTDVALAIQGIVKGTIDSRTNS